MKMRQGLSIDLPFELRTAEEMRPGNDETPHSRDQDRQSYVKGSLPHSADERQKGQKADLTDFVAGVKPGGLGRPQTESLLHRRQHDREV